LGQLGSAPHPRLRESSRVRSATGRAFPAKIIAMRHEFSLRFQPTSGAKFVQAQAYVRALEFEPVREVIPGGVCSRLPQVIPWVGSSG